MANRTSLFKFHSMIFGRRLRSLKTYRSYTNSSNSSSSGNSKSSSNIASSPSLLVTKTFLIPTIKLLPLSSHHNVVDALQQKIGAAPMFYRNAPIVLDLSDVQQEISVKSLNDLRQELRKLSLIPLAVTNAGSSLRGDSTIPILNAPLSRPSHNPQTTRRNRLEAAEDIMTECISPPRIIKGTIRSGQQVYAAGGDLVVMGSVGSGAEVLADGNIHIYGTLRGRALCGLNGDRSASIFCVRLNAELVSIADVYVAGEHIPPSSGRPSVVSLADNGSLAFVQSQDY